jgi:hypothetical protein
MFQKIILIIAGSISLILGIIGIFIPILPTTPFLLLTAACWIRGSERLYKKLLSNKFFGSYIRHYYEKKGVPMKVKISAISFLWGTILTSILFFNRQWWLTVILLIIAAAVTFHIIRLKTYKEN